MLKKVLILLIYLISFSNIAFPQIDVTCDIYSRYVWRGTDFGNSASIQPGLSYTTGPLTIGAWSAWQHSGTGSENDLYATYSVGDFSLTITDYYFPGTDFNSTAKDTGAHNIEISLGASISGIGITTGMFLYEPGFYGVFDTDKAPLSKYLGFTYGPFLLGFGDGGYSSDGEFAPIEIGVTGRNDKFSCSWILNPDSGNAFLVVGMSL